MAQLRSFLSSILTPQWSGIYLAVVLGLLILPIRYFGQPLENIPMVYQMQPELKTPETGMVSSLTPTMIAPGPEQETTPTSGSTGGKSKISTAWPESIQQWGRLITKAAKMYDLPPDLYAAVIYKETWFSPDTWPQGYSVCPDGPASMSCTSRSGAIGAAQVMPFHFTGSENPRDPKTNIYKGASILRAYIDDMGSVRGGVAAYNCGPTGARNNRCGATGGWVYADAVLGFWERFAGSR